MSNDFRTRIDPELRAWYDASPGFDFGDLPALLERTRAQELEHLKPDAAVHTWETQIEGAAGAPPIKLRIYEAAGRKEPQPALLFFHGGGFLFGSVYRQEALCQHYVKEGGCVVISVGYRLTPKWRAPAPVEDAFAALCWAAGQGAAIGIDPARIAAAGLSAGGTIVAALAMMTRAREGPRLCLQMPLYAELDARMETASSRAITDPKLWCYENNKTSWERYLPKDRPLTAYDVPALCQELAGLPPLFSYVGELDPVRDENLAFWQRLMAAGVAVEGHIFPGAYHCFELGTPEAQLSRSALSLSAAALRRAFANR